MWGVRPAVNTLLRTLLDIGPRRLQRRFRYELRQRLDRALPLPFVKAWAGALGRAPAWLPDAWAILSPPKPCADLPRLIRFSFLNDPRDLPLPICWNLDDWPRLWQFHLHYFDWAREWLEMALVSHVWPEQATLLETLLDGWIACNTPARGDGWHSYTISLRSRNWVWLFRCCPALATPERLDSLWHQLCWLQSHPEHANGGNHWLENLSALAVGGLQFHSDAAQQMHQNAMALLEKEIHCQLLADGGHEERSASYHILMLDRLVELACLLGSNGQRPEWLVEAIAVMTQWLRSARLLGGGAPRCNDSSPDASPPLDVVLGFANSFVHQCLPSPQVLASDAPAWALRESLLRVAGIVQGSLDDETVFSQPASQPLLTDLPHTGWTLLRPGAGWEVLFKCGVPCPPHLPAHVHSDQLGVDVFCQGMPVLAEAGTSVYGTGPDRLFERSGAAHNVLQLAVASSADGWIEPVDVWSGFRAGRKAQPRLRRSGLLLDGHCFAEGSHDGYRCVAADHHRRLELLEALPARITLRVVDTLRLKQPMRFRCWWHLAPRIDPMAPQQVQFEAPTAEALQASWHDTWLAQGFGKREPRRSRCLQGLLPIGQHQLHTVLCLPAPAGLTTACLASG